MVNKLFAFMAFFISWLSVFSQSTYPRDTSFTLETTYQKELKYRPYIKIPSASIARPINNQYDLVYKRIGDRSLKLDLFSPKSAGPIKHPGIILIHGGGWSSGDKSQMHMIARELASKDYICYTLEYRLSPEAPYPAALLDLKDAIAWIKQYGPDQGLDTSKIAALGTSAGGQLASLLGTTNGKETFAQQRVSKPAISTVQAVINIDGVLAFHHPESAEGKSASIWLLGNYKENPANWTEASALSNVSANAVPILFLNSSNARFHAGRDDLIKKLDYYGIYSQVHEFADTPHPFWFFEPWYTPMINKIEGFLKEVF